MSEPEPANTASSRNYRLGLAASVALLILLAAMTVFLVVGHLMVSRSERLAGSLTAAT